MRRIMESRGGGVCAHRRYHRSKTVELFVDRCLFVLIWDKQYQEKRRTQLLRKKFYGTALLEKGCAV